MKDKMLKYPLIILLFTLVNCSVNDFTNSICIDISKTGYEYSLVEGTYGDNLVFFKNVFSTTDYDHLPYMNTYINSYVYSTDRSVLVNSNSRNSTSYLPFGKDYDNKVDEELPFYLKRVRSLDVRDLENDYVITSWDKNSLEIPGSDSQIMTISTLFPIYFNESSNNVNSNIDTLNIQRTSSIKNNFFSTYDYSNPRFHGDDILFMKSTYQYQVIENQGQFGWVSAGVLPYKNKIISYSLSDQAATELFEVSVESEQFWLTESYILVKINSELHIYDYEGTLITKKNISREIEPDFDNNAFIYQYSGHRYYKIDESKEVNLTEYAIDIDYMYSEGSKVLIISGNRKQLTLVNMESEEIEWKIDIYRQEFVPENAAFRDVSFEYALFDNNKIKYLLSVKTDVDQICED